MNRTQYLWIKLSSNNEVRARINAIEKYEMDKSSKIAVAKEEGLAEGLEKGKTEGLAEWLEKGAHKKAIVLR